MGEHAKYRVMSDAMREAPEIMAGAKAEMKPVLDKLASFTHQTKDAFRRNITEKSIYRQAETIRKLTDVFIKDPEIAKQSIKAAYEIYSGEHKSEEGWNILQMTKLGKAHGAPNQIDDVRQKEGFQTVFSAYLFAENRRLFQQSKDVATYDVKKEARQIESVVRALAGQHGQIGTGEGKTSVILPITALVQAYSTEGKKAVFSADSTLRTQEFVKNITPYKQIVEQAGLTPLDIAQAPDPNRINSDEVRELRNRMEREALFSTNTRYSLETRDLLKKQYWQSYFEAQIQKNELMEQKATASKSVKIELSTHDNLVWQYMEDENEFKNSRTPIIMDEAHAPADRGTPYQRVSESLSQSPEEIRRAASEWLLHYVVGKTMSADDIQYAKGVGELKKGDNRLKKIKLSSFEQTGSPLGRIFEDGVEKIAHHYNIKGKNDIKILKRTLLTEAKSLFIRKGTYKPVKQFEDYVSSIGNSIAQIYFDQNEAFTTAPDGGLIIRDGYQDELLSSHEYTREMALATLGLMGSYKAVSMKRASGSLKYASFIHGAADRLVCFSGTLKDDEKETPFGHFLEKETGRKIFVMEKPEKKRFPRPRLDETASLAVQSLLDAMKKDDRNMLIIDSTNIDDAKKTADVFKRKYGEDKVVFIGSKESGEVTTEAKYERWVEQCLGDLAEGKIKAIVSTGSIGTGMNIVKSDGGYPDIKIGILGIPQSKLQIKQIIGRRRAIDSVDKEDYFWYLGKDRLTKHLSNYKNQLAFSFKSPISIPGREHISIGGTSQQAKLDEVLKAEHNPEALLPVMLDIIRNTQNKKNIDTQFDIEYDDLFKDILRSSSTYVRNNLREKLYPGISEKDLTEKEKYTLAQTIGVLGIPSSLYWDVQTNYESLGIPPTGGSPSFTANHSERNESLKRAMAQSPFLKNRLDDWISETYDSSRSYYETVFGDLLDVFIQSGFSPPVLTYLKQVTGITDEHNEQDILFQPIAEESNMLSPYIAYDRQPGPMNPVYMSTQSLLNEEIAYQVRAMNGGGQLFLSQEAKYKYGVFPIIPKSGFPIFTFYIQNATIPQLSTERSTPGISSA